MALNLRRGLFRMWVVASILWVVGATIGAYFLFEEDIAVLRNERSAPPEWIRCTEKTDDAFRPLCDLQNEVRETIRKLDREQFIERRKVARLNILWAGLLIAGPPILAFLLVGAFFWVIRGFR
jgi:hypothetical protein